MSLRRRFLIAGACGLLAASLQGCSTWEWAFGGPAPEDMTEIRMHLPAPPAPDDYGMGPPAEPASYPTEWHRGQLLD